MSRRTKENLWLGFWAFFAIVLITFAFVSLSHGQQCDTTSLPVVVNLDNEKNDDTIAHARSAVITGQPRVLHIARSLARTHRFESLRNIPTRRGFDRDEYPPASTSEGGFGANVDYVESSDNRSAGARMRFQLKPYCEGQAFILEPGTP